MKISLNQYTKIAHCFPRPRKPPVMSNLEILNALLYMLENGCKWRALPSELGNWHTIYVRLSRWAKSGILQEAFLCLQKIGVIRINVRIMSLDSTSVKVHPDGHGALKKEAANLSESHAEDGIPRFIWSPHLIGTP